MYFMYNGMKYNLNLDSDMDESGAFGVWDLAGEIGVDIGLEAKAQSLVQDDEVIYGNEFGQDIIYNVIKGIMKKLERMNRANVG